MSLLQGPFPNRGLRLPTGREKAPFMTCTEVERRIAAGESDKLWESVFLTRSEIDELPQTVDQKAAYPRVAVMFWFAAHTGERRSEMPRARKEGVGPKAGTVLIRKKKPRRYERECTRRLPLSEALPKKLPSGLPITLKAVSCLLIAVWWRAASSASLRPGAGAKRRE